MKPKHMQNLLSSLGYDPGTLMMLVFSFIGLGGNVLSYHWIMTGPNFYWLSVIVIIIPPMIMAFFHYRFIRKYKTTSTIKTLRILFTLAFTFTITTGLIGLNFFMMDGAAEIPNGTLKNWYEQWHNFGTVFFIISTIVSLFSMYAMDMSVRYLTKPSPAFK